MKTVTFAAKKIVGWILYAIALGVMLGLACCGDNAPADPCYVAPDWNIGYSTCDSSICVVGCGVLPQDGSPGHRLPNGCVVDVGTSDTHQVTCVESCEECHERTFCAYCHTTTSIDGGSTLTTQ